MPEITVTENEDVFLDFTLKYGRDWAVSAKRGLPVILGTDSSTVYFYARATASGSNWLTLSDALSTQIERVDAPNGKIRVKLGSNTGGHVADNQLYEVRIKFADGSYVTAESGALHVKESYVDRP